MQLIYTKDDLLALLKMPGFTVTRIQFEKETLILHLEKNAEVKVVNKDGLSTVQEH
ncbi:hypothetical protein [Sulfuricurvum sp.]|uniref:hypothetical protein n=1 Tax=Sulfuricurvum sp. TaxID=2025608 RepID=UPI00356A8063